MNESMQRAQWDNDQSRMMRLAEFQDWFLNRYSEEIGERLRQEFRRDLLYMIQLVYREAQEPLVKQITDLAMRFTGPYIVEKP